MQKHLYILTGGSRGMGLAIAQRLLHPDHALICISRQANDTLAAQAKQAEASLSQWTQDLSDGAPASERLGLWLQQQGRRHPADCTAQPSASARSGSGPARGPGSIQTLIRTPLATCETDLKASLRTMRPPVS